MARPNKYPDELIQRGVRLALEGERPIAHIAHDLGMHPETLRKPLRQAEADSGALPELLSSQERQEIRRLRKDDYELRRANEILKWASVFRQGARPRPTEASAFIDQHRERFAVEPVCRVRGVSASYYQRANGPRSERSIEDERLIGRIREVHAANYYAYGYRRMWKALLRAGDRFRAARSSGSSRPWRTTRPRFRCPTTARSPSTASRRSSSQTASGGLVRSSSSPSSSTSAGLTTATCTKGSATSRRRRWRLSTLPGPRPISLSTSRQEAN